MPYGDIKADRIITSTQTIDFDALAVTRDAYKIAVDNGFVGTEQEWLATLVGEQGPQGERGLTGGVGQSAYEVALSQGFVGSKSEWLATLVGATGSPGAKGDTGSTGPGVPAGGSTGQLLAKTNNNNYETTWVDPPTGADSSVSPFLLMGA